METTEDLRLSYHRERSPVATVRPSLLSETTLVLLDSLPLPDTGLVDVHSWGVSAVGTPVECPPVPYTKRSCQEDFLSEASCHDASSG